MSDSVVQVALVGTSRAGSMRTEACSAAEALASGVGSDEAERLLLRAGAWAVYRLAGREAAPGGELPAPAAADPRPVCAPGAARLLEQLLGGDHADLLPEAFGRLAASGQRLPPELLPAAMDRGGEDLAALREVLGERGRWLSQFEPRWRMRFEPGPSPEESLTDADWERLQAAWEEGPPAERRSALEAARAGDPARARGWLASGWKSEKAEQRAALIQALKPGLSQEDEPFLETALDDRSENVRAEAARLLCRVCSSAFVARARTRADAILLPGAVAPGGIRGLLRTVTGVSNVALMVVPPADCPKEWQRDGITTRQSAGVGQKSGRIAQALMLVPPAHWEARLGADAPTLVSAAGRSGAWAAAVVEGWSQAALLHGATHWVAPLWDWWARQELETPAQQWQAQSLERQLFDAMPAEERMARALSMLQEPQLAGHVAWPQLLAAVPAPWSSTLAGAYLAGLRRLTQQLARQPNNTHSDWLQTLPHAARCLPLESLADAAGPWEVPEGSGGSWGLAAWRTAFERFSEVVDLRRRMVQEIA